MTSSAFYLRWVRLGFCILALVFSRDFSAKQAPSPEDVSLGNALARTPHVGDPVVRCLGSERTSLSTAEAREGDAYLLVPVDVHFAPGQQFALRGSPVWLDEAPLVCSLEQVVARTRWDRPSTRAPPVS